MTLYLGIDLGTQGLKALLLDPELGVVETASEPLTMIPGLPPGHSEQHPEHWLQALIVATQRVLASVPGARTRVAAIGVAGQQHGFVPLDAEQRVIRPAKLWNDVSAAPQCAALTRALGGERKLFELTGNRLAPGFTAGKIRWLLEHEPAQFARLRLVLLPHDYLNLWLTGAACMEPGDASGTGCFDVRARCFRAEVCEAIAPGLLDRLPALRAPGEPAGRLRRAAAEQLGLEAGLLVSHGSGDNMMAAIGAGAFTPGTAVMSLGTSGTVFANADEPICDPGGELAAFCNATGGWLPLGCTMNATVTTELVRQLFSLSLSELEALATTAPAGSDGVLCLPFFTGERSPDLPLGTGAFLGLTPQNTKPGMLVRAAFEGATFALARLADRLATLGLPLRSVRLTGGGARSPLWQRIVAATLGLPVMTGVSADAAALGAAVHALWTARRAGDARVTLAECARDLPGMHATTIVTPDPSWQQCYAERRRAYESAVQALTPVFPELR